MRSTKVIGAPSENHCHLTSLAPELLDNIILELDTLLDVSYLADA